MIEVSSSESSPRHWDLNSDPPGVQDEEAALNKSEIRLRPETPKKDQSNYDDSIDSVADDVLSSRKSYYKDLFPSYSSSPTRSHRKNHEEQAQKLRRTRASRKDENVLKRRGGLECMENFVMRGEHQEETQRLQAQALEHAIPDDLLETLEWEQQEDLQDDELIELIDQREQWEKELDQVLSELIIK